MTQTGAIPVKIISNKLTSPTAICETQKMFKMSSSEAYKMEKKKFSHVLEVTIQAWRLS